MPKINATLAPRRRHLRRVTPTGALVIGTRDPAIGRVVDGFAALLGAETLDSEQLFAVYRIVSNAVAVAYTLAGGDRDAL